MFSVKAYMLYVLAADMCYGILHVILSNKLSKINTLTLMSVYVPVVLGSVLLARALTKTSDPSFDFPQGNLLVIAMMIGIIVFAAEYCYVGAYNHGADPSTVAALALLTPVFTAFFGWVASKLFAGFVFTVPNMTLIAGYVLSAVGVCLVVEGSRVP
ncbi:hypothetical protein HYT05_02640 [Candidatus Kaiserbacteria bacterium]|nr:hypothetical protein [Candidatus Kaiserbacteria bacterium]